MSILPDPLLWVFSQAVGWFCCNIWDPKVYRFIACIRSCWSYFSKKTKIKRCKDEATSLKARLNMVKAKVGGGMRFLQMGTLHQVSKHCCLEGWRSGRQCLVGGRRLKCMMHQRNTSMTNSHSHAWHRLLGTWKHHLRHATSHPHHLFHGSQYAKDHITGVQVLCHGIIILSNLNLQLQWLQVFNCLIQHWCFVRLRILNVQHNQNSYWKISPLWEFGNGLSVSSRMIYTCLIWRCLQVWYVVPSSSQAHSGNAFNMEISNMMIAFKYDHIWEAMICGDFMYSIASKFQYLRSIFYEL